MVQHCFCIKPSLQPHLVHVQMPSTTLCGPSSIRCSHDIVQGLQCTCQDVLQGNMSGSVHSGRHSNINQVAVPPLDRVDAGVQQTAGMPQEDCTRQ